MAETTWPAADVTPDELEALPTNLPIAGISLTVSIARGLIERSHLFSLLRLAGTPLSTLRRVSGFQAAAPLLITAAASIAVAFFSAYLFRRAQLGSTFTARRWSTTSSSPPDSPHQCR